ncbi:MAG: flippase [Prolixibacteraceae bacterium]|nr:flippase [Prolixibacteraceae bacterium]
MKNKIHNNFSKTQKIYLSNSDVINNIIWLFLDKAIRLGVGFFIGTWFARYLGVEQFGIYNYVIAFVSIFGTLASLGMNGIIVRDLVNTPKDRDKIISSILTVLLISGSLAYLINIVTVHVINKDLIIKVLISIYGLTLISKASDIIRFYFEAQIKSKYVVVVENIVFIVISSLKIMMILMHTTLIYFIWLAVFETFITSFGLIFIYYKFISKSIKWIIDRKYIKRALKDSIPIFLSAVGISIYMRIDQVMLGQILGNESVGVYSAALRLSELWYLIPTIIISSAFPKILRSKSVDISKYNNQIIKVLKSLNFISIIIIGITSLFSVQIILLVYGNEYLASANVLIIHIWTGLFVGLGIMGGNWYIANNLQKIVFYRTLIGAGLCVFLNLFLIPKYGPMGAAISTLISQAFSNYIFDAFSKKTRELFNIKTRSFFYKNTTISQV